MTVRIIPRLDIKGPNLVKGIHLEGLRVLGIPENFARLYYEQGADELFYMDVVASLLGRNNLYGIVEKTAREIFIPLTVGGGLRTIDDITQVLRVGADKVAINTAAIQRPRFIRDAARRFGTSTIVVAIEAMKKQDGTYEAYTNNGREKTGKDVFEWAQEAETLGAGEILLTSINQDGTGRGFDLELVQEMSTCVSIPVIAHGGAGTKQHIVDVFKSTGIRAVSLGSILHYNAGFKTNVQRVVEKTGEGNTEFLQHGKGFSWIEKTSIQDIKRFLQKKNIPNRIARAE